MGELRSAGKSLGALATGGFAIGTSEFLIFGLLPQIAHSYGVSIGRAGDLVSAYALGVVVGAPTLTALSVRLRRRTFLIVLMSWYAVANAATAIAPNYPVGLVARFASGLPHGAFFGVGAVVAGSLVPANRRTTAMALVFAGLTVANIVGVPISTLVGQHTSWRVMYLGVAVIAGAAATLVALFVPDNAPPPDAKALRAELRSFADRRVWLVFATAIFGFGGFFATFSYITPMMTQNAHFADSSMTWLLILFGVGMTIGNLAGARLADRIPFATVIGALSIETALSVLFAASTHERVVSVLLVLVFPAAALAAPPALQAHVIALARGAPNVAAASMQAAFNVANSIGAYLGGVVISAGFGYAAPNLVAAGLVFTGLLLSVILVRTAATRRTVPVAPG